MKLCMMSCMIYAGMTPEDVVKTAVDCGMEAVDWISTHQTSAAHLKKLCDDAGLKIAAHTMLKTGFMHRQPDYLDEFKASLEDAAVMESPILMVPPFGRQDQVSQEDDRKAWIDFYAEALPLARKAGITLTLESTGCLDSPITTAEEMLEVLHAVPGLKLTFDYGNMCSAGDASGAYELLKDYIVHIHLKDYKIYDAPHDGAHLVRCGKYFKDVLIGNGDLKLKKLWMSMKPEHRKLYVNLETRDFTGVEPLTDSLRRVADVLRQW